MNRFLNCTICAILLSRNHCLDDTLPVAFRPGKRGIQPDTASLLRMRSLLHPEDDENDDGTFTMLSEDDNLHTFRMELPDGSQVDLLTPEGTRAFLQHYPISTWFSVHVEELDQDPTNESIHMKLARHYCFIDVVASRAPLTVAGLAVDETDIDAFLQHVLAYITAIKEKDGWKERGELQVYESFMLEAMTNLALQHLREKILTLGLHFTQASLRTTAARTVKSQIGRHTRRSARAKRR